MHRLGDALDLIRPEVLGFEPVHLDSERERTRAEQAGNCSFQFTLDGSVLSIESDEAHSAPARRRDCCCLHIPPLPVSVREDLCHPAAAGEIGRRAHASFNEMNRNREV